jgi:Flp pilus assembly protein TadD
VSYTVVLNQRECIMSKHVSLVIVVLLGRFMVVMPSVAAEPNSATDALERGKSFFDKGDSNSAIAAYTEAIRLEPTNADAYYDRGVVYRNKGEDGKAFADYTEAIRLKPDWANPHYNRGLAYWHNGDFDKAIADYTGE